MTWTVVVTLSWLRRQWTEADRKRTVQDMKGLITMHRMHAMNYSNPKAGPNLCSFKTSPIGPMEREDRGRRVYMYRWDPSLAQPAQPRPPRPAGPTGERRKSKKSGIRFSFTWLNDIMPALLNVKCVLSVVSFSSISFHVIILIFVIRHSLSFTCSCLLCRLPHSLTLHLTMLSMRWVTCQLTRTVFILCQIAFKVSVDG